MKKTNFQVQFEFKTNGTILVQIQIKLQSYLYTKTGNFCNTSRYKFNETTYTYKLFEQLGINLNVTKTE